MIPADLNGEALLELLGHTVDDPSVRSALHTLARDMEPELDPEDDEDFVDWILLNELGLEMGFEDEAYVRAFDPSLRREGPLLLSQLYFYDETSTIRRFSGELPFSLTFDDDRRAARAKLEQYEASRRSYIRDAWTLPAFDMTLAYGESSGLLESVYCHLRHEPWPPRGHDLAIPSPEDLIALFGKPWSDPELHTALRVFELERKIGEIRSEHEANLRAEFGLELMFTAGYQLGLTGPREQNRLVFAAATFYASRELDARQWDGPLLFGLQFEDSQPVLFEKMDDKPEQHEDETLSGFAVWHFPEYHMNVMYSNLENRILRVTLMAPGY